MPSSEPKPRACLRVRPVCCRFAESLAKLFSLMDPNSPERVAFVSRALKWSSGGSGKLGHPRLHQLLALTLWKGRCVRVAAGSGLCIHHPHRPVCTHRSLLNGQPRAGRRRPISAAAVLRPGGHMAATGRGRHTAPMGGLVRPGLWRFRRLRLEAALLWTHGPGSVRTGWALSTRAGLCPQVGWARRPLCAALSTCVPSLPESAEPGVCGWRLRRDLAEVGSCVSLVRVY